MKRALIALALLVLFTESGWAHGGAYTPPPPFRPPSDRGVPGGGVGGGAGGPSGPATGGPAGPGPSGPGPTTPPPPRNPFLPTTATDELPDPTRWQLWWSYNRDAFLDVRARVQAVATTSPENVIVVERKRLQALLVPEFVGVIEAGDNELVLRQTLLALARLARIEELHVPLERLAKLWLGRDSPNLQEAALLALGVGGGPDSIALLRHVLMDDAAGREQLAQKNRIPTRMRVFAAYALGLLGRGEPSEDARRPVVHALLFALGQEGAVERELRVACVLALGLVPIRPCETPEEAQDPKRQIEELHLCGGAETAYLLTIANDPEADPWFRGHAAAALGRLAVSAGPGFPATDDHPVTPSRDDLVRALVELARSARDVPAVVQGCMLGLGEVADSDADEADVKARECLRESLKRDEPMARRFALISLASAVGRPGTGKDPEQGWKEGSGALVHELGRATGGWLGWSALAVGVAGHERVAHKLSFPQNLADVLRSRLADAQKVDEAAACALGMAVLHSADVDSGKTLQKSWDKQASPAYRVCGGLALGILGYKEAQPQLEKALGATDRPLQDMLAASVGLRLLADPDIVPDLVKRLAALDAKKNEDAQAIVNCLAFLQDPFAGEPLLELLRDQRRKEDLRSAVAWCLGVLADPESPEWTSFYANGIDYNLLPWTLRSPHADGRGLLDWR